MPRPRIVIRSVPHTGTHFMRVLLKKCIPEAIIETQHYEQFSHYKNDHEKVYIAPIRHPYLVWKSWESRGTGNDPHFDFFSCWKQFNDDFVNENMHIQLLPLDTKDRQVHLDNLSVLLGHKLITDWIPVSSKPHKEVKMTDLTDIYQLEVVRTFYDGIAINM
jgi:hypothetical protein